MFVSFLSLLFLRITEINHIHLFILPLSILMGLMISKIKNQLMAETIHLILILTLAAAEASIGLAIVLQFYRRHHSLDIDAASEMHG